MYLCQFIQILAIGSEGGADTGFKLGGEIT